MRYILLSPIPFTVTTLYSTLARPIQTSLLQLYLTTPCRTVSSFSPLSALQSTTLSYPTHPTLPYLPSQPCLTLSYPFLPYRTVPYTASPYPFPLNLTLPYPTLHLTGLRDYPEGLRDVSRHEEDGFSSILFPFKPRGARDHIAIKVLHSAHNLLYMSLHLLIVLFIFSQSHSLSHNPFDFPIFPTPRHFPVISFPFAPDSLGIRALCSRTSASASMP
jgi:hypothetical protein